MSSDEGKLFVGGLSFDTTDHSLERAFCKFGDVSDAVVVKDHETKRCRGFGFVTFRNLEDAKDVLQSMNGESLDGRQIRVDLAGKSSSVGQGGGYSGGRGGGRGYSRGGGDSYGRRGGGGGYGGSRDYYGGSRSYN